MAQDQDPWLAGRALSTREWCTACRDAVWRLCPCCLPQPWGTEPFLWPPSGPAGHKASLGWVRVLRCAKTLLRLAHSVLFGLGDAGRVSYPLPGPLSAVLEVRKAGEGAGSCMVTPPFTPPSPARLAPGTDLPSSRPHHPLQRCGETSGAAAPSCARAEGLQGKYLLLSPSAKGAILSAQTLQSSGQEAKVNSEKVFKRPNTHTLGWGGWGACRGVAMRLRKGSFLL